MKKDDAREILNMLKAATTQYPLEDSKLGFWLDSLERLDAEIATKAVLQGIKTWRSFPTWAEYQEIYTAIRREAEAATKHEQIVTEGKRGYATPEWVWVWSWARFWRQPRDERSFPQQGDYGDPFNMMNMLEYEGLRQEWLAADSPKKNPLKGVSAGFSLGART